MTVVDVAVAELGVEEEPHGSNSGKRVNEYLHAVGLGGGYSWCMAFCVWCYNEFYGASSPLKKTGGVLAQWHISEAQNRSKVPVIGSVFIMDFGGGLGHAGIVESIEGDYIHTIEGNSNDEGSREGYEVCRRKRKISTMKGFITPYTPAIT